MLQIAIQKPDGRQTVDFTKDCFRIGNSSEIAIPVADAHIATVYRRNGQIHFSNRSARVCKVGRQAVSPNESAIWKTGKTIDLGDGVTMQLLAVSKNNFAINDVLSFGKVKKTFEFREREGQPVDDKVVAMLCAGLLFYALTLL